MTLEVSGVGKSYGRVRALDGCDLRAVPGRLLGLLGPNGAGKTTLMRVVLGLVTPDSGTVRWRGEPLGVATRSRIGYMPEERGLYPAMRVAEQVVHFARLAGLGRRDAAEATDRALERVELADAAGRRLDHLSHGNQQRAQLAVALVHDPDLLILDEPFAGLDPLGVDRFGALLADLAADGRTVVFSSHQLDLVANLCRDVVIIDHGRVVLSGDLAELRAATPHRRVEITLADDAGPHWWPTSPGVSVLSADQRSVSLLVDRGVDLELLVKQAAQAGPIRRFDFDTPSLEEMFREAVTR